MTEYADASIAIVVGGTCDIADIIQQIEWVDTPCAIVLSAHAGRTGSIAGLAHMGEWLSVGASRA